MSYILARRITEDRIAKSLEKYNAYVAKNGEPTAEDMKALIEKAHKWSKAGESRLYWWAIKVYNGWLYTTEKKTIWS
jgi:hypothetical protein